MADTSSTVLRLVFGTENGKTAPSNTQNGGGIKALHLKEVPQGSELCMVCKASISL